MAPLPQIPVHEFFENKKILLIGGTGSVGKAMLDQLLRYNVHTVRIYSRDEYKQFNLSQKYKGNKKLRYLIGDIRDYDRVKRAASGVDVIINLAAMKHVPACEYNPFEAVKTNVLGTQNVIDAAMNCHVKNVIYTSSDKAINSTNAMGSTKLLAERLMSAAEGSKGEAKTIFSVVRFGNVMGSRGSVIPLFKKQILENRKITVTDPQMTRFMMSISDAVHLTLKAMTISKGGEIFVLKMPILRLKDLADSIIERTCKKYGIPESEVQTDIIGLRGGEKMYEELMTETESVSAFELPDMYAILSGNINDKTKKSYMQYPKASVKRYTSKGEKVISRQEVLQLIDQEALI